MAVNVEVEKTPQESTANLVRRFTKKVQSAGIVNKIRRERYFSRMKSHNVRKTSRLKMITRRAKLEELIKLGKAPERPQRGKRR